MNGESGTARGPQLLEDRGLPPPLDALAIKQRCNWMDGQQETKDGSIFIVIVSSTANVPQNDGGNHSGAVLLPLSGRWVEGYEAFWFLASGSCILQEEAAGDLTGS